MKIEKTCPVCGDPVIGRTDKKFCTDQCRAEFNNRINKDSINLMRRINSTLRRNRRILVSLNNGKSGRISRQQLAELGFDFRYFTSMRRTETGDILYYCYEQGYLPLEENALKLVSREGRDA